MPLERFFGLDRHAGAALPRILLCNPGPGLAPRLLHHHVGPGPGPLAAGRGLHLARDGRAGDIGPVAHPLGPAAMRGGGLAGVRFGQSVPGRAVFGLAADRRRVRPGGRGELLGDECGGVLAQGLGILRGLGRGDAHRAGGADRPPVRAYPFRQPGEEGLAELALDGPGVGPHLRRLLGPGLGFLAGERGALLEALHAGEVGGQALVEAHHLALAGLRRVAARGVRDAGPEVGDLVALGVVLHALPGVPLDGLAAP